MTNQDYINIALNFVKKYCNELEVKYIKINPGFFGNAKACLVYNRAQGVQSFEALSVEQQVYIESVLKGLDLGALN